MKIVVPVAMAFMLITNTAGAAPEQEVRGRVISADGKPAADIDVAAFWRANGSDSDANGKPYDEAFLRTPEGQKTYWGNLGNMHPWGAKPAQTDSNGRFVIGIPEARRHLLAMDRSRKRGGIVVLPKEDKNSSVEIRLEPLIRVKGLIEGPAAGERPEWTHVSVLLPEDPTSPLDMTRLVSCGSVEARFEMSLPPGRYILNAYSYRGGEDNADEKAEVVPDTEILLTRAAPEVDLGILRLSPFKPTITSLINRAKASNTWNDYTEHYGEKPPEWNVVDARGVKKDARLSDFKGKWVLVDFWGLSCRSCLRTGMPKLIKFYEEHQAERDRFEILALCIDEEGGLKSIADVDKQLEPIVKHVWKKPLPFPVLLDSTFKTWERFGLSGLGTVILIDPEGKLVEGDETVLADKLKPR
ncbi:MAG TPA: redoxin domain-containing protein [Planctomycetaceae bacterium]